MVKTTKFLMIIITAASLALTGNAYAKDGDSGGGTTTTTGSVVLEAALLSGLGVETTAISGNTALISTGTTYFSSDRAVYVVEKINGVWQQQAKLVPNDLPTSSYGRYIAVNGNTAVVSDSGLVTTATGQYRGATYIFRRTGTVWRQEAKILGPGYNAGTTGIALPSAVSVSGDTAVIGLGDDGSLGGKVEVYVRNVSAIGAISWAKQTTLSGISFTPFGKSVAIDGNTLVVGGENSVRVFQRSAGIWSQQANIRPGTPLPSTLTDFGASVSLSGDAVLIGTSSTFDSKDKKRAYVFRRTGTTWSEEALLTDPKNAGSNGYGFTLGISGNTVVVADQLLTFGGGGKIGTPGAFLVFKRGVDSKWSFLSRISTKSGEELFGYGVSISGNTILTGRRNLFKAIPRQAEVYRVNP
jgi:hypothetical protein